MNPRTAVGWLLMLFGGCCPLIAVAINADNPVGPVPALIGGFGIFAGFVCIVFGSWLLFGRRTR